MTGSTAVTAASIISCCASITGASCSSNANRRVVDILSLICAVQPVFRGKTVEPHRVEEMLGGLVAFRGEHMVAIIPGPLSGTAPGAQIPVNRRKLLGAIHRMRVNLSTRSGADGIRMANSPGADALRA